MADNQRRAPTKNPLTYVGWTLPRGNPSPRGHGIPRPPAVARTYVARGSEKKCGPDCGGQAFEIRCNKSHQSHATAQVRMTSALLALQHL